MQSTSVVQGGFTARRLHRVAARKRDKFLGSHVLLYKHIPPHFVNDLLERVLKVIL